MFCQYVIESITCVGDCWEGTSFPFWEEEVLSSVPMGEKVYGCRVGRVEGGEVEV